MDEKRRASRHRVLKTGTTQVDRKFYGCVVRNLSDTGAALDLFYTLSIPDKFKLVLADEDVGRDCCVVWLMKTGSVSRSQSRLQLAPCSITKVAARSRF